MLRISLIRWLRCRRPSGESATLFASTFKPSVPPFLSTPPPVAVRRAYKRLGVQLEVRRTAELGGADLNAAEAMLGENMEPVFDDWDGARVRRRARAHGVQACGALRCAAAAS